MRAIVLAAGEGLRNRPLTHARPKVMLPVGNRPILEHALVALHAAEIHDVTLVVGYKAESVQAYFQDGHGFGVDLRYARQPQPKGSADALLRGLESAKGKGDVLVVPGDNYVGRDVLQRFLSAAGNRDALLYTTTEDPQRYGVVELNDEFITAVLEKPRRTGASPISTGIVKFSVGHAPSLKPHARTKEGLTDFLTSLGQSDRRLKAVPLDGPWFDVDRPEDLLGANALHLATETGQVDGTMERGASAVGEVRVGRGSRIRSGSYLVGPVVVGEGCEIGPNAVVYGPTTIGDNVTIGPFTELLECVVMQDSRIASGCTLHHAVLDRGVILAPRVSMDRAHAVAGPSFGAVIGDGTVLGNNVVVRPGSVVGVKARVAPQKVVGRLPDEAQVV